jgi:hypothetical protein
MPKPPDNATNNRCEKQAQWQRQRPPTTECVQSDPRRQELVAVRLERGSTRPGRYAPVERSKHSVFRAKARHVSRLNNFISHDVLLR